MIKKTLTAIFCLMLCAGFGLTSIISASEYDGSIDTGVDTGVDATVLKAAPTASPVAGEYHATQSVTLTAEGSNVVCYTTDDTTPACATTTTCSGTGTVYSSAISVTLTEHLVQLHMSRGLLD